VTVLTRDGSTHLEQFFTIRYDVDINVIIQTLLKLNFVAVHSGNYYLELIAAVTAAYLLHIA